MDQQRNSDTIPLGIPVYQQIIKSAKCNTCILGIEDIELTEQFINLLLFGGLGDKHDWRGKIRDMDDAITLYKSCSICCRAWTSRDALSYMECPILNAFLPDEAYELPSLKYSNIIENRPYSNYRLFLNRMIRSRLHGANTNHTIAEEKEEKYFDDDEQITLKTKHIKAANGFMIVYDARHENSLNKIRKHLNEIFEIKGYFEIFDKLKKDEMCFFPILLIGINFGEIRDESQKITKSQINKLAMEYCVDNERVDVFIRCSRVIGDAIKTFVQNVIDYHYYRSLSDEEIHNLKANCRSGCSIL